MRDGRVTGARGSVLLAAVILTCLFPAPARAKAPFVAPVEGRIVKRFQAPLGPYASGHRGVDFGAPVGAKVVAAAAGKVKFAGSVGGEGLFITIAHSGNLESTYSFLSRIDVTAGTQVQAGQPIGVSGQGHPGAHAPALQFRPKAIRQVHRPRDLAPQPR